MMKLRTTRWIRLSPRPTALILTPTSRPSSRLALRFALDPLINELPKQGYRTVVTDDPTRVTHEAGQVDVVIATDEASTPWEGTKELSGKHRCPLLLLTMKKEINPEKAFDANLSFPHSRSPRRSPLQRGACWRFACACRRSRPSSASCKSPCLSDISRPNSCIDSPAVSLHWTPPPTKQRSRLFKPQSGTSKTWPVRSNQRKSLVYSTSSSRS